MKRATVKQFKLSLLCLLAIDLLIVQFGIPNAQAVLITEVEIGGGLETVTFALKDEHYSDEANPNIFVEPAAFSIETGPRSHATINALHNSANDIDVFTFEARAGQTFSFDIDCGHNCGTGSVDTAISLFDSQNRLIKFGDDSWMNPDGDPNNGNGGNIFFRDPGSQPRVFGRDQFDPLNMSFDAYVDINIRESGTYKVAVSGTGNQVQPLVNAEVGNSGNSMFGSSGDYSPPLENVEFQGFGFQGLGDYTLHVSRSNIPDLAIPSGPIVMDFGTGADNEFFETNGFRQNGILMSPGSNTNPAVFFEDHWLHYDGNDPVLAPSISADTSASPDDNSAGIHDGGVLGFGDRVKFEYYANGVEPLLFSLLSVDIEAFLFDPALIPFDGLMGRFESSFGAIFDVTELGTIDFTVLEGWKGLEWVTFSTNFECPTAQNTTRCGNQIVFDNVTIRGDIPEPATLALFAFGLTGLFLVRRKNSVSPRRRAA